MDWNIKNKEGEIPIMVALKNKETEMVKILLKTSGVDLSDVTKLSEGQALLKEMLQKADEDNRKLHSIVPECPVSHSEFIYINLIRILSEYLFPGLSQSVLS